MKPNFTYSSKIFIFLLFLGISTAVAQTVPVIVPSQGFEIDGNLKANSPTAGIGDWIPGAGGTGQHVFELNGTAINTATTYKFTDLFDTTNDNIFKGGKFNDDPNTAWSWSSGKAVGKGDINNVLIHLGVDPSNNQWLIIASDRLETTGTSYIDFEFFQNALTPDPNGSFKLVGGRSVNDILLTVEYTNGGSAATVYFYRWNGTDYVLVTDPATNAFGKTNSLAVDTMTGAAFGTSTYTGYQFVEAAINISAFLNVADPCAGAAFGNVLVKTKNSAAPSASLNDFAGPYPVKLILGSAEIIGGGAYCKIDSSTKQLTINGVQGGTYTALPSGLSITSSGLIDIANSTPGTYTVNYSFNTGGCPKNATTEVTINSLPTVTGTQTVCVNSTTVLIGSGTAATSTPWVSSDPSKATVSSTGVVTGVSSGTADITYTNNNGCQKTVTVTVNPIATLVLTSGTANQTVCAGTEITGTVYTWGGGATNVSVTNLPAGLTSTVDTQNKTVTISGTPTANGTYSVSTTGQTAPCQAIKLDGIITVNPIATLVLTSGTANQTVCAGTAITGTVYTWGGGATNVSVTNLPAGLTSTVDTQNKTVTISGTPTANGTYSVSTTGQTAPCQAIKLDGIITVNPIATLVLTSGTANQTVCAGTAITGTVYTWGGGATNVSVTNLPAGLTSTVDTQNKTVTISGTPTANGTYSVSTTGQTAPCQAIKLDGIITANPIATLVLTSGTANQTVCAGTAITGTVYTWGGGATNVSVTNLPAGLTSTVDTQNKTVTISGTPTANGTYSVSTTGQTAPCQAIKLDGIITVNPIATLVLTSGTANQTVCAGTAITGIVYTWGGGATNVSVTNLPAGLTSTVDTQNKTVTISGTPTANGTYSVSTTGQTAPCQAIKLDGIITVNPIATLVLTSGTANQTVCAGTAITGTVYTWGGGATNVSVTNLPAGLTSTVDTQNKTVTISGTPTANGTYSVSTTGQTAPCQAIKLDGIITVNPIATLVLTSGTANQTVCAGTAITGTVYTWGGGATNVSVTNLPAGLTSTVDTQNKTVTISGTPTANGTYSVSTTGQTAPCQAIKLDGIITVNPIATLVLTSGTANQTVCAGTAITGTVYTWGGGATNVSVTNLPAGLTSTVDTQNKTVTISGTPTANGTYSVSTTGHTAPCTAKSLSGIITVNTLPDSPISAGNITQCKEPSIQTLTAIANVPAGHSIVWYDSAENGSIVENPILNTVGTVTYFAQAVDNNTACISKTRTGVTLTISPCSIELVKTGVFDDKNNDGIAQAGETINYSFEVKNTGNLIITNIIITDQLVSVTGGPILSLAPNGIDNTTFKASYVLTQTDIDAGLVTNFATATGQDPNQNDISGSDEFITDLKDFQKPEITLVKTGVFDDENNDGIAQAGETINYSFEVRNTGNLIITNIIITDQLVSVTGGPILSLAPNGIDNTTFKASYVLTQTDIDAGLVTNFATATGQDPNQNDISGSDEFITDLKDFQKPEITLVKTGVFDDENNDGIAQAGETINYSFEVRNTGNLIITNIIITDQLVSVTGGPILSLAPNGIDNTTFKASYILTQADIDAGLVTNFATATGQDPNQNDISGSDEFITDLKDFQKPEITLVKTGVFDDKNNDGIAQAGETINYSFEVKNTGNLIITNIIITDQLVSVTGGPILSLAPNGIDNTTFKASYVLTQADIDAGLVTNFATATGQDPNQNDISGSDEFITDLKDFQKPEITLVKTGVFDDENNDGIAQAGETINYSFEVRNTGNLIITNIIITDQLVSVTGGPILSLAPNGIDNTTFKASYVLTQADIDAGLVTNFATATGQDPNQNDISGSDEFITDLKDFQKPEITLVKTGVFDDKNNDGIAQAGETINYSFEVRNTGNLIITNIIITDQLVSVTGGPILSLAPNGIDNTTFKASYILTQADIDAGLVTNFATATGQDPNQNDISGSDEFITDLKDFQKPEITLVKTGVFDDKNNDGIAQAGETINYSFEVRNTGNLIITNIIITDQLVSVTGGPILSLAPSGIDNTTFKASYILTQADIDAGLVTNFATATGQDPNQNDISGSDEFITDLKDFQKPEITLVKTGVFDDENNDGIAQAGETINYSFEVKNTGNLIITNIIITDQLVSVTGGPIVSLAPNGIDNTTFKASYVLTQADIDAGLVTNFATATGQDPNQNDISGSDEFITDLKDFQKPEITLVKTGVFDDENNDGIAQAGETINYSFEVRNTGNLIITNIIITDQLVSVTGGPILSLAPSGIDNTTFKASYILTQADIDAGLVTNFATATGQDPNQNDISGSDEFITDLKDFQKPEITLVKTGVFDDKNNDGIAQAGETINYSFEVRNTGNLIITNIIITDQLVSVTGGPILSLAPNGIDNTTFKASYVLTQADIDAGLVTNFATATGQDPNQNDISGSDEFITDLKDFQKPEITLVKTGVFDDKNNDGIAQAGETINYSFEVRNTGNLIITNIIITDQLVSVTGGPILSLAPNGIDNTTFKASYVLTQADIDAGLVTNFATATGQDPNQNDISGSDEFITDLKDFQKPEITLVKTGVFDDENNDGIAQAGETINYSFEVKNTGNLIITNIIITDQLVSVTGGPILSLAPSGIDNTTFKASYVLTQADIDAGLVTNFATATGQDPNQNDISGSDEFITDLKDFQKPEITLVKTGVFDDENNDGIAQAGETINYSFEVRNTGNLIITNIIITDQLVSVTGGPILSLAPSGIDNTTFKASYVLTQADIDAGLVTNFATATGQDPNQNDISGSDEFITDLKDFQKPEITLVKTGVFDDENNDGIAQAGEIINYSFEVRNTGNLIITNIIITDQLVSVTGGPILSLAPNGIDNTTFKASYVLTQADIDAGLVTNFATATGQDPNQNDISGSDEFITDLKDFQKPEITLVKTGVFDDKNNDGIAQAGETINYSFEVRNTGNLIITNIIITDQLVSVTGGPILSLAPSGIDNTTFKASYVLTQADIDAGLVTNFATATGQDPNQNDISGSDEFITDLKDFQKPEITLVKTGVFDDKNNDGIAQAGETINYSFEVRNTGNLIITNIIITDQLVSVTGGPILSLAPSGIDNTTFKASYILTQTDIDAGLVTNFATATGQDPNQNDISGSDEFITDLSELQNAEIALLKTAEVGGTGAVGDIITYTFAVTNLGNVIISNINITDITNPSIALTFVNNPIATLAPSETKSITGTYTITQADIDLGRVTNSALAEGQDPNGQEVKDISGTTMENDTPTVTTLTQNPSLTVIKTTNSENYSSAGDIINYTITVQNTGNVTLFRIAVKDPLTGLDTVIASLAPGISQEYAQTYTVTQNDIENRSVTNVATANGFTLNDTPISASAEVVVEAAIVLPCGSITVHNAFSPNGDGINELFIIDNIDDTTCYPDNTVEIYNRWGVLVYETRGYNNSTNVFDGTSQGRATIGKSSGLPTGVYFYILSYTSTGNNGEIQTNKKDGYLYLTR